MATNGDAGLAALGDPTRREIFRRLARGPMAVGELAGGLPVTLDRAAGTRRLYQLDPDGVAAVRDELDRVWTMALAAFKAAVEEDTR